ncbi:MAG TPA: type II toxin-antitoxin system VapC family toxin [Caulobacteraceae bacterium]|nr:type II toxin-antitoxin system VapC family toxin [Caulobacteraceae bacterium]
MIVVDASAVLAILLEEPEAKDCFRILRDSAGSKMSAVNFWEVLVRARAVGSEPGALAAEQLLIDAELEIVPADREAAREAARAFARYGRRTSAGLNLGDCFAYALAKREGAPLLYKGDDFSRTDIRNALSA